MSIEILDPTFGDGAGAFALAARLGKIEGSTIGLISNGKKGTKPFFKALETNLLQAGAANVVIRTKANYSAPAEPAIMAEAAGWDATFTGIGD